MTVFIIVINTVYTIYSVYQTAVIVLIGALIYFIVLFILNKQIKDDAFRTLGIKWIY
jgi:hypothetical protein